MPPSGGAGGIMKKRIIHQTSMPVEVDRPTKSKIRKITIPIEVLVMDNYASQTFEVTQENLMRALKKAKKQRGIL